MKARIGSDLIALTPAEGEDSEQILLQLKAGLNDADVIKKQEKILIYVEEGTRQLLEVARILDRENIQVEDIQLSSPTLDDIFLKITGEGKKSDGE